MTLCSHAMPPIFACHDSFVACHVPSFACHNVMARCLLAHCYVHHQCLSLLCSFLHRVAVCMPCLSAFNIHCTLIALGRRVASAFHCPFFSATIVREEVSPA
ncbi:hypothetical protein DUNSADRAFT_7963 [Dunaliella salina]|uniref:Uncharacterized protein n=1 Tax=Dunaliella salina TaxID=3046 RepID=A0ABQ7H672_DUNSA|nr:hypothetical protein DUNSADRAFT_7963 [Dunaliella salina]|eukprot:KAF5842311.1 hypothetical protein DUNSADRAFT_7963 [Dunaliella salina]